MRFTTPLFVLCCLTILPACMAATDSVHPGVRVDDDFAAEPGFGLGFDPSLAADGVGGYGAGFDSPFEPDFDPRLQPGVDTGFRPSFDPALPQERDPRLQPECGCVFPSADPDVSVTALCGEAVCFEEASYFCTYEGMAVNIGECIGEADGGLDLEGYEFPEIEAAPASCQGNAGACDGASAATCEEKIGCDFLPSGECIGEPLPCSSRIPAACNDFGGECFLVSPFS